MTHVLTVYGGHAIMLGVTPSDELLEIAQAWVMENEEKRALKEPAHVTLSFIGRNLLETYGERMEYAARELVRDFEIPEVLRLDKFDIFGAKKDHLVATMQQSLLNPLRNQLLSILKSVEIVPSTSFKFNPHVTLTTCESNPQIPTWPEEEQYATVHGLVLKIGDKYAEI